MLITLDLMSAFVRCRYQAYLKCTGEVGEVSGYASLQRKLATDYEQEACAKLAEPLDPRYVLSDPPSIADALTRHHRLILNAPSVDDRRSVVFPAIERLIPNKNKPEFAPIAFSPNKKLSKDEKHTAALTGTAISCWHELEVKYVRVIHGPEFSSTRLVLLGQSGPTHLAKESLAALHDLETLVDNPAPPLMYLNNHCGVCEYRDRCRKDAVARDDLSLLRGLQPKEIEAWKKRGIFTVTQLSYTFRAKTMGRSSQQPKRHSQPLQAMAIRDKKTYIRKRPEMPTETTRVYFDVEGIPEREFFYLIGAVVVKGGNADICHQFWADDETQQETMWQSFLSLLDGLEDYRLIHFGRYEREFFREMQRRCHADDADVVKELLPRLLDVHAAIRTNVFFPVYANGLKDIGTFLEAHWDGPVHSGIDSIVWRHRWEASRADCLKQDLLRYNHEDCLALATVFNHLVVLSQGPNSNPGASEETDGLPDAKGGNFSRKTFATPALKAITKSAYFNYQQEKVFFRTDRAVKKSVLRKRRSSKVRLTPNTVTVCGPLRKCPTCGSEQIGPSRHARAARIIKDVKFVRGGVKRWMVKYETGRYMCRACGHTCYSPDYPTSQPEFGRGLAAWAVYQHVALCQSFASITQSINDVFDYSFSDRMSHKAQVSLVRSYGATEASLVERLRRGNMICVDEARVDIREGKGYVWVFSGPEVVVYRFSESRDASVLNVILEWFNGVVVSDFYSVYDSISCSQQKCLVHLTRDINDDLLKTPFDEELKAVACRFTELMTPIIESIDRFGLSKRHLGKFVKKADDYQKWMEQQRFTSSISKHYQARIGKYGSRLFTFLHHDGVPWNNNIAENAVKLFASRRRFLDGLMNKDGIKDYLIFLSIFQTVRRKGGSFLRFLLSGKADVFEFFGE